MAIRFIPCRHSVTRAETELPETALQHMPAWVPTDPADRERLGYDEPAETPTDGEEPPAEGADGGEPPGDQPARRKKPAGGAAKNTKENNDGH